MPNEIEQAYRRVNTARLQQAGAPTQTPSTEAAMPRRHALSVRWMIIPLSVVLCTAQMIFATVVANTRDVLLPSTLIPILAFGALFGFVLLVNPMLRAVFREKILRPLNRAELTCVFTALLVTSGIATFGMASPLVPTVAAPWNPDWNSPQRGWSEDVNPHLNRSLYLDVPAQGTPEEIRAAEQQILDYRRGVQPRDAAGNTIAQPAQDDPLIGEDSKLSYWLSLSSPPDDARMFGEGGKVDYWVAVWNEVPWMTWVKPLALWMIFIGACYAMFYCLSYTVLNLWVRREQLIFPLAQLPEQLLPDEKRRTWLPATLRNSGFWIAFAVIFFILSWNAAVNAQWIPGLNPISISLTGQAVTQMFQDTILQGTTGGRYGLQFQLIFTAIGVAFLLPTEISFSLWFYYLVANSILLVLVWLGYGQTGADFPSGIYWVSNTIASQGAGALFVFAGISLTRAIADLVRLSRGQPWAQRLRLAVPVIGLAISLAVIMGWLMWNGLPLIWALAVTAIITLLTLGLLRVVAEGGVYWLKTLTGPLHIFKVFGLGHVLKGAAIVPLLPIYAILFFDVKTFMAPNIANSAKMQEDVGGSRGKFHLNLILCLIISVVVALAASVFLSYLFGAQQMQEWFYGRLPENVFDNTQNIATDPPDVEGGNVFSYLFGGAWVVASMAVRRFMFWFPHPIGYIMFVNPMMATMWLSFFVGWIAKKLVVRYGGKATYDRTRPIFIGIILGEAIAILLWTILGLWYDFEPGISLNTPSV